MAERTSRKGKKGKASANKDCPVQSSDMLRSPRVAALEDSFQAKVAQKLLQSNIFADSTLSVPAPGTASVHVQSDTLSDHSDTDMTDLNEVRSWMQDFPRNTNAWFTAWSDYLSQYKPVVAAMKKADHIPPPFESPAGTAMWFGYLLMENRTLLQAAEHRLRAAPKALSSSSKHESLADVAECHDFDDESISSKDSEDVSLHDKLDTIMQMIMQLDQNTGPSPSPTLSQDGALACALRDDKKRQGGTIHGSGADVVGFKESIVNAKEEVLSLVKESSAMLEQQLDTVNTEMRVDLNKLYTAMSKSSFAEVKKLPAAVKGYQEDIMEGIAMIQEDIGAVRSLQQNQIEKSEDQALNSTKLIIGLSERVATMVFTPSQSADFVSPKSESSIAPPTVPVDKPVPARRRPRIFRKCRVCGGPKEASTYKQCGQQCREEWKERRLQAKPSAEHEDSAGDDSDGTRVVSKPFARVTTPRRKRPSKGTQRTREWTSSAASYTSGYSSAGSESSIADRKSRGGNREQKGSFREEAEISKFSREKLQPKPVLLKPLSFAEMAAQATVPVGAKLATT